MLAPELFVVQFGLMLNPPAQISVLWHHIYQKQQVLSIIVKHYA